MPSPAAVPELAFSHMGLYVRDLAAMEDFYTRVLGFTVTDRGNLGAVQLVFLSRNPAEHHQVVMASGRPAEAHFNVINQISFRVGGVAALRHFHVALAAERVTDVAPVSHGNAISLYFRDPEGNRLELFFDTPWYCAQPVREPVDFSRSDEQILADTERIARSLPDFKPRAAWMAELEEKMRAKMQARPGD